MCLDMFSHRGYSYLQLFTWSSGVFQSRPSGPPGGDEGRATGRADDANPGCGPRLRHQAAAQGDVEEKVSGKIHFFMELSCEINKIKI